MSYATRRRRHDLTLADKKEIIRLIDNRTSQTDVAKIYNCSQSQISRMVSRRDEILADWEKNTDPAQKRRKVNTDAYSKAPTADGNTSQSYVSQSTSPRPPADNSAEGQENTQTQTPDNNGWLEYWKNHSASFSRRSYGGLDAEFSPWSQRMGSGGRRSGRGRPKASANKESRISNQLLDVLKNYELCDVYCADELALQYDAMPNMDGKALDDEEEGEDRKPGEGKKQITVFLTCNVTGSDKRDFLIIEDSIKMSETDADQKMPGFHRARAPHAWMTSDVYKEYLLALDYDMRRQRRYALLLVDNAAPHIPEAGLRLEHVRILYVRSYATPFFHGIFYSVRAHYRRQILLKLFAQNPDFAAKENVSDKRKRESRGGMMMSVDFESAVSMLKQAWLSVSAQDVVQCFSKAGICAPHIHGLPDTGADDNLPELPDGFITDVQFEEFVNVDVDSECCGDADLLSTECRILSDLRQQGFADVGLEPSDDDSLCLNTSAMSNTSVENKSFKAEYVSPSSVGWRGGEGGSVDANDSTEVHGALMSVRSFLQKRNLHLHNLHALEAQIFSCNSGGPKA